jgi:hypothetical protein
MRSSSRWNILRRRSLKVKLRICMKCSTVDFYEWIVMVREVVDEVLKRCPSVHVISERTTSRSVLLVGTRIGLRVSCRTEGPAGDQASGPTYVSFRAVDSVKGHALLLRHSLPSILQSIVLMSYITP